MVQGKVMTFQELRQTYGLQNFLRFGYLQLRHTINWQFPYPVTRESNSIEHLWPRSHGEVLCRPYTYIWLWPMTPTLLSPWVGRWKADIPDLEEEAWQESLYIHPLHDCGQRPLLSAEVTTQGILHPTEAIKTLPLHQPTLHEMCTWTGNVLSLGLVLSQASHLLATGGSWVFYFNDFSFMIDDDLHYWIA